MLKIYRKETDIVTFHRYILIDEKQSTVWSTGDHKVIASSRAQIDYPAYVWMEHTVADGFELVGMREGI